jgi:hypothetical protein
MLGKKRPADEREDFREKCGTLGAAERKLDN